MPNAEEQLYKAVLVRAIKDAQKDGADLKEAVEAREWLLMKNNPDRTYICECADFSERVLFRWASVHLRPLNSLKSRLSLTVQNGRSGRNVV